jgi:tellurium resistance protein TerZ
MTDQPITPPPAKGHTAPLNHTLQSKQRVMVGLSWDPREDKVTLVNQVIKSDSQHDLDVSCYIYNKDAEFIDYVGAEASDSMDESGKIYHSGDDMSGAGDGDDESISAELAALPEHVHALIFMVDIRSNHVFQEIEAPMVRLADGMTDNNLLKVDMIGDTANNKNAFILCAILRSATSPSGWMLKNINDYPDISKIEDWGQHLAQYVD